MKNKNKYNGAWVAGYQTAKGNPRVEITLVNRANEGVFATLSTEDAVELGLSLISEATLAEQDAGWI